MILLQKHIGKWKCISLNQCYLFQLGFEKFSYYMMLKTESGCFYMLEAYSVFLKRLFCFLQSNSFLKNYNPPLTAGLISILLA